MKNYINQIKKIAVAMLISICATFTTINAQEPVKLGFIPLTDCSPIVMAKELGLFKKYGVEVIVTKESSWANVRDKILTGELDGAHCLYSMPFSVYTGVGGKAGSEMKIAMMLNVNGQAITLSNDFCGKVGFKQMNKVTPVVAAKLKAEKEVTFAMTFPGGTHDLWLRNWMSIAGLNQKAVKIITIPPPQMVANMKVGNMDGYCVGEPWGGVAVKQGVGFTQVATQDIWKDHPEKVLGTTAEFVAKNPNTTRAMIAAILDACKYIDAIENRAKVAKLISAKAYVNTSEDVIVGRFIGDYDNGIGKKYKDPNYMKFYQDGAVNFPYLSDGMWFLTQHKRWGLLKADPDYLAIATKVNEIKLYSEAAALTGTSIPKSPMRSSKLMDGVVWDGSNPAAYAASFKIKA